MSQQSRAFYCLSLYPAAVRELVFPRWVWSAYARLGSTRKQATGREVFPNKARRVGPLGIALATNRLRPSARVLRAPRAHESYVRPAPCVRLQCGPKKLEKALGHRRDLLEGRTRAPLSLALVASIARLVLLWALGSRQMDTRCDHCGAIGPCLTDSRALLSI